MLPRATSTARRRKRARRRAADQQARVNALLEAMAALATLQGEPGVHHVATWADATPRGPPLAREIM